MKIKKALFLTCLMMLLAPLIKAQGQHYELKGTIVNPVGNPVSGADVQLVKMPGRALVKVVATDASGSFAFANLAAGQYQLQAAHYEFAMYESAVLAVPEVLDLGKITLQERNENLKEVEISTRKPFIEQRLDRTVLNVENSVTAAGNNALEVLEKAPGVIIDQNDNISMRGRSGVLIMVDGKQVPMTGTELATFLRGLSANSVEKIELITNPSSKYDAAGNAGIIDIRMKKDKNLGTNGTLSSSFGHGVFPKLNQGLQLNHRSRKMNIFGSYNYVYRKDFNYLNIYREFFEETNYTGAYDQKNRFTNKMQNNTLRFGLDYYLTPKTIIGVVTNGFITTITRTADNKSLVLDNQRLPASTFLTTALNETNRFNKAVNFNIKHTIDSTGKEISADLDYASYNSADLQNYTTTYFNLSREPLRSPYLLHGDMDGELSIKSAKVDYTQPLKVTGGTLEIGLKSSLVKADNILQFFDRSEGGNRLDLSKSNHFIYKENINAAYLNGSGKWGKVNLQLGLRAENTIANGKQLTDGQTFDRNYTQLFPSVFVSYDAGKIHTIGISMSRRIDRPSYHQLNPFKFFLDPSTYSAGNPFLLPQLTYSFEATHTYKQRISTKFFYSHTTDVMLNVLAPSQEENKVVIQMDRNLARYDYYGMDLSVPFSVGKWFNSTNNVIAYYGFYRGNLANTNLRNGRLSYILYSMNSFTLPNNWNLEVVGNYRSNAIDGFLDVQPLWSVSVGAQRQFFNKKLSLKLNASDIFYTNKVRATTALYGYFEDFYQRRDVRVVTLSATYRFGKNQVAPSRKRTSGAEEEKRRAG